MLRDQILQLVNNERMKVGLNPLMYRPDILPASDLRAKESSATWSHTRPDGSPYYTADDKIYGENLSRGFKTATEIVQAWMQSDSHRKVMLDPKYHGGCVGVHKNKDLFVSLELTK